MKVTVELGPKFAAEAGLRERVLDLPSGATVEHLLLAAAAAMPRLSVLDEAGRAVDLAAANLSVNGRAVDPRHPEAILLHEGDRCYLYGIIGGG